MLAADKINLGNVKILLVDDNPHALDLLAQMIAAFGARNVQRCQSVEEARGILGASRIDLIFTDAKGREENGYDLIEWLRREGKDPNRYAPVVLVTGHTRLSDVKRARDCGANFVVAKPVSPEVLLERICWSAMDKRPFVSTEVYVGPDRRFKLEGPPKDSDGRRADDLSGEVGEATEPNMSQDEISALMKGPKVAVG